MGWPFFFGSVLEEADHVRQGTPQKLHARRAKLIRDLTLDPPENLKAFEKHFAAALREADEVSPSVIGIRHAFEKAVPLKLAHLFGNRLPTDTHASGQGSEPGALEVDVRKECSVCGSNANACLGSNPFQRTLVEQACTAKEQLPSGVPLRRLQSFVEFVIHE